MASLGAKFIAVEDEEFKQAQTAAGYAKPMSAEYQKKQAELVANHIKTQDIVITTALIPGRPAPKLITAAMIESMKPGAVIVDLAAERGGNTELTQPGKTIDHKGVTIMGPLNLAGEVPVNASSLYAKNLLAFLETMIDKKDKVLKVNWDDEIVKGTLVAKDGKIVHPSLQPRGREMQARTAAHVLSPLPLRGEVGVGDPRRSGVPHPHPLPEGGGESAAWRGGTHRAPAALLPRPPSPPAAGMSARSSTSSWCS